MDRARRKTDKMLNDMERRIERVYTDSPALRRTQKKYAAYMDEVEKATRKEYLEYLEATDEKEKRKLKKEYAEKVKDMTFRSKKYNEIVSEITDVMAELNQETADIVNAEMTKIFVINYNQVAVDCKKVGIKVNGETE